MGSRVTDGPRNRTSAPGSEIGYLYGAAVAYGVGTGIWVDAEAYNGKKVDPGIASIGPLLFGAAMPVAVFLADMKPMREGLPSAIASGLVIGGGEGLVAAAFGNAHAYSAAPSASNPWGFTSLSRAEMVGATLGGATGVAYGLLLRPTPQRTMFITSAVGWGSIVGYEFGGGGTSSPWSPPYNCEPQQSSARAGLSTGGLAGYNIALIAAAGTSAFWTPSWNQLGWMWGGFAVGEAAGALVFPIYAATGGDARHGFIFMGVAGSVGAIGGAFLGHPNHGATHAREEREDQDWLKHFHVARIRGGGLMPVEGGMGASLNGQLW